MPKVSRSPLPRCVVALLIGDAIEHLTNRAYLLQCVFDFRFLLGELRCLRFGERFHKAGNRSAITAGRHAIDDAARIQRAVWIDVARGLECIVEGLRLCHLALLILNGEARELVLLLRVGQRRDVRISRQRILDLRRLNLKSDIGIECHAVQP
ncbi:hypothetical protein G3N58_15075 [Paraburkholderia sp. Ac-20342]|uniref:hypothetical protein n=1 Tax=Paraburkholderia sp. Ac-20342 TaxID=2703889 RepID=UPI001981DE3D|nr:hypothetical protein [Paraburkholderia sp. Ac-20342]MBN3848142.1 hypothetical protein [Paraburkholderia sp. Ac-20342]